MAIELDRDFGIETKRFADTISRFTKESKGVTSSVTQFAKSTKLSSDVIEKFSGSLKTQLENLSTNVDSLSDEIFKSDKPFLVDTQKLNEKIGVAQATIDVLSAKLENSGNEFVKLTESEKEVVKQQIAAARNLVEQTQAFGFGAKQVLAQLQTKTLSSVEDFTLNQISRVPIIGPFFSGFISDTIKILRTRRIERAKAAKETLLQEAKEKAQREADIDFLVNSGAVKDRQEAERKLLQERENNIKKQRIEAELEQLEEFRKRGLITEKQFQQNKSGITGDPQKVKIDESNADDVIETVSLSDEAVEGLGDNFKSGVIEGTSSAITTKLLPGFKNTLSKTFSFLKKPDPSRMKEMALKQGKFKPDEAAAQVNQEGSGVGGVLQRVALALGLAGLPGANKAIIAGGAAIGIGLGAILTGIGAGGGLGLTALAGGITAISGSLALLNPRLEEMSDIDGDALKNTAEGVGAMGGALAKFGAGGLVQSLESVVSGIVGLFTDSPMEKIEKFGKLGDDVQQTADALEDATPKLEKFYNMLAGKNFSNLAGFTTFTEEFLEGSQNIVKAFKGGRNIVSGVIFKGLEDIKVDSIDQVKGLIDSVANLSRANLLDNLSNVNRDLMMPGAALSGQPIISTNVVNQANSQGVVMPKSVTNDNLDAEIAAYRFP